MNIREYLQNLTKVVEDIIDRQSQKPSLKDGAYNNVSFGELTGLELDVRSISKPQKAEEKRQGIKKPVQIAIAKLKRKHQIDEHKRNKLHSQGLADKMEAPHGALLLPIAYKKDGQQIFPRKENLYKFLERNKHAIDIDTVKDFIGQMVVIIEFLHEQNIIHLDIKPQNFFISMREDGTYQVFLGDLAGINKVDGERGRRSNDEGCRDKISDVTSYFIPKKLRKITNYDRLHEEIHKHDLRALDCYALGRSVELCMEFLSKNYKDADRRLQEDHRLKFSWKKRNDLKKYRALKDLAKQLKERGDQPPAITTIQAIVEHHVFGETYEKRKAYLDPFREAVRQDMYADDFYVKNLQPGDYFYLLPKDIKHIYLNLEKLEKQLFAYSNEVDKHVRYEMHESIVLKLKETCGFADQVLASVDLALYNNNGEITKIREDLQKEIDRLEQLKQTHNTIDRAVIQKDVLQREVDKLKQSRPMRQNAARLIQKKWRSILYDERRLVSVVTGEKHKQRHPEFVEFLNKPYIERHNREIEEKRKEKKHNGEILRKLTIKKSLNLAKRKALHAALEKADLNAPIFKDPHLPYVAMAVYADLHDQHKGGKMSSRQFHTILERLQTMEEFPLKHTYQILDDNGQFTKEFKELLLPQLNRDFLIKYKKLKGDTLEEFRLQVLKLEKSDRIFYITEQGRYSPEQRGGCQGFHVGIKDGSILHDDKSQSLFHLSAGVHDALNTARFGSKYYVRAQHRLGLFTRHDIEKGVQKGARLTAVAYPGIPSYDRVHDWENVNKLEATAHDRLHVNMLSRIPIEIRQALLRCADLTRVTFGQEWSYDIWLNVDAGIETVCSIDENQSIQQMTKQFCDILDEQFDDMPPSPAKSAILLDMLFRPQKWLNYKIDPEQLTGRAKITFDLIKNNRDILFDRDRQKMIAHCQIYLFLKSINREREIEFIIKYYNKHNAFNFRKVAESEARETKYCPNEIALCMNESRQIIHDAKPFDSLIKDMESYYASRFSSHCIQAKVLGYNLLQLEQYIALRENKLSNEQAQFAIQPTFTNWLCLNICINSILCGTLIGALLLYINYRLNAASEAKTLMERYSQPPEKNKIVDVTPHAEGLACRRSLVN